MPSEGRPRPIDTAVIVAPGDIPASDVWSLVERRERHRTRMEGPDASSADALAALALGAAITARLADEQPLLVRDALRLESSWAEIATALGTDVPSLRSAFDTWADGLTPDERASARRLAEAGESA